jgi:ribosome biogenesis GTPase
VLEGDARESGAWAIQEIAPRTSKLARRSPGGGYGERVLVANVDQVVVVFAAARPEPHERMLDRFLVVAEANEIAARVVVNKAELVGDGDAARGEAVVRERFADFERAGYPLHVTSVAARHGLEALRGALAGRTSALTGPSGVGKSSLMNALFPGLSLRVGAISDSVNKGRHTTVGALAGRTSALTGPSGVGKSSLMNALFPGLSLRVGAISDSVNKGRHTTVGALLHPLPGGGPDAGFVVDTPGLREIGFWGLAPESFDSCFPELRPFLEKCRFADCAHVAEPGCGVRDAVAAGAVSAARYDSYVKLREEVLEGTPPEWA